MLFLYEHKDTKIAKKQNFYKLFLFSLQILYQRILKSQYFFKKNIDFLWKMWKNKLKHFSFRTKTAFNKKNSHDIIKKTAKECFVVRKNKAIISILVACLSFLFLFSGCGKDDWNKGEPGVISFTMNDKDPNMFGEIVTKEKAEELGFKKPKKITLYKINETKNGISPFETYIDIASYTTEYIVTLENTFLNKEILVNKTTAKEGAYIIVDFDKQNTVVQYCRSITGNNEKNEKIPEELECAVLDCYYYAIKDNFVNEQILFYCMGQPYNTENMYLPNGKLH